MLIECDRAMMKHLLRTWAKCRLRPQGVSLAHERPRLIALQGGVCPVCKGQRGPLVNDGKAAHITGEYITHKDLTYGEVANLIPSGFIEGARLYLGSSTQLKYPFYAFRK